LVKSHKIWKITVNQGNRTGKRRLIAKSQHFTGRILLRTGTNTQEGDYLKRLIPENSQVEFLIAVFQNVLEADNLNKHWAG
jgi:hypothetical protein